MLSCEVIGFLGADAKKTEKGFSFNVSHKYKEKGNDKTLWISCFVNYETKVFEYLKAGAPVFVYGDISLSTYTREGGEVVPTVTMSVRRLELLPNKNRE